MSLDPRDIEVEDVRYEGDKRIYVIEGDDYYSVTSKLGDTVKKGEQFYRYLASADSYEDTQKTMKKAGKRGTKVHDYCEKLAKGEDIDMTGEPEDVISMVQGFKNWCDEYDPTIIDTEFVVFCEEFRYAGRVDLMAEIDGKRHLIDHKTSSGIYDKHKVQLMFYRYGLEEGGVGVDELNILHLKENTKKGYCFKSIDYWPEMVRAHNDIFDWQNRDEVIKID